MPPSTTPPTAPPAGEMGAVKEAAKLLAEASNPVIAVSRAARTENGVRLLVQLAEALQARVIDTGERMNFPKGNVSGWQVSAAARPCGDNAVIRT